jgi:hypothetical protein
MSAALGGRGHGTQPARGDDPREHELTTASITTPTNAHAVRLRMLLPVPILRTDARVEIFEHGRRCVVAEVLLFHHAQGQTQGFLAFADELRSAGHVVHAPDLYDGKTFTDLDEGVGYAKEVGFGTIQELRPERRDTARATRPRILEGRRIDDNPR